MYVKIVTKLSTKYEFILMQIFTPYPDYDIILSQFSAIIKYIRKND